MNLNEFIQEFTNTTKANIIKLAETELNNENKKLVLDHRITDFLENSLEKLTINFFLKIALKKLLLPNIPLITQIIFDLLKDKVKGITK